jgi:outer membrane lipoprotein-sorting protein
VLITGLLALLLPLADTAQPQNAFTLDQVYAKIDEVSKTFKSTEANIERTKVTVIVDDKDTASGKFYYTKQGNEPRLKLELNKPDPQFVLVDKGKLQIYTPKIKQVQEASTAGRESTVELFLALGFGQTSADLKKNFTVALVPDETVDGQRTSVLEMTPKSTAAFKSVRLWLDQKAWHALQIKTVEKSNDYLIVKFSSVKMNAGISDSRFKLSLPKDVKVIKL